MDDQHGILMDSINELRLALVRGMGREQVGALLEQVVEFTRMHFWSEEQLMEQSGFPGLEEHRAAHRDLLDQIRNGARRLEHGEGVRMRPLLCGLRDGYLKHIECLDSQYGPWLNERGIC
jgi:hemerythrin-like metal-binding protein